MRRVDIRQMGAMRVAALAHRGPYGQIGAVFARLGPVMSMAAGPGVALYYDDPDATPPQDLRAHAGVVVAAGAVVPDGFEVIEIAAGRYAVLRYVGPYEGLPDAWAWLYRRWLPQSGEVLAGAAPFELNLNSPGDTAPQDLITDLCVRLR